MANVFKFKEVRSLYFSNDPLKCSKDTPLSQAIDIMNDKNTGSIVVTDKDDRSVGIFTERDLLRNVKKLTPEFMECHIEDFMTPNPKTVSEETTMDKTIGILRLGRFRHIIVTSETTGKLPQ